MTKESPWPQYAKTIPQLFYERFDKWQDHVVFRYKSEGEWKEINWAQFEDRFIAIASGLMALGVPSRGIVSILSNNRPEWSYADMGSLTANIMNVPIYPTNTAEQVAFILNDSGAEVIFVEDQSQLDKIMKMRDELPKLRKVVVIDPFDKQDDFVMDLEALMALGREKMDKEAIFQRRDSIDPEDVATLIYTSGTTGNPKGVMLCHRNLVSNVDAVQDFLTMQAGDTDLQFLPMCHSFGRMEVYVFIMHQGTITFAENIAKIPENLKEVKPLMFITVPRLLEKVHAKITEGLKTASPVKKSLFNWALGVGKTMTLHRQAKTPPPLGLKIQHALADKLIYSKVGEALGGNLRILGYGAAPLAFEIEEFFMALNITVLAAYGLTETSPGLTGNKPNDFKLGTVGKPLRDTTVKIAADGEIIARGPQIMHGYWNRPEDSAEALEDGWFHTGDIGEIDEEGFLRITDRKKDLIITAGGKNVAPQNIENLLKLDPAIEQVAIIGDRKKYLVALLVPDFEWLKKFADEKGIGGDAAQWIESPEVVAEYERRVVRANSNLAKYETIKKFRLLPEEFTVENNMLTPTMKVRRKNVLASYNEMIEGMYE